jgi:hypothetical protein
MDIATPPNHRATVTSLFTVVADDRRPLFVQTLLSLREETGVLTCNRACRTVQYSAMWPQAYFGVFG